MGDQQKPNHLVQTRRSCRRMVVSINIQYCMSTCTSGSILTLARETLGRGAYKQVLNTSITKCWQLRAKVNRSKEFDSPFKAKTFVHSGTTAISFYCQKDNMLLSFYPYLSSGFNVLSISFLTKPPFSVFQLQETGSHINHKQLSSHRIDSNCYLQEYSHTSIFN